MKAQLGHYPWALLLIFSSVLNSVSAQSVRVITFRSRVVTTEGTSLRGILADIDETHLFIRTTNSSHRQEVAVPLSSVRKVVLRRVNNWHSPAVGAILGGILAGYLSAQSLQKNQASNSVTYGITLSFAAIGGAAGGLLVGAAVGNITRQVVRPSSTTDPALSLVRQLEPFTIRHQQRLIDQLPLSN